MPGISPQKTPGYIAPPPGETNYTWIEQIFNDIMTNISDSVSPSESSYTDFLRASFDAIGTGLIDAADQAEKELKITLLNKWEEFQAWYNTDVGFWSTLGIAATAVVVLPFAVEGIGTIASMPIVQQALESVNNIIGSAVGDIDLGTLTIMNDFAKTFFPNYKLLTDKVNGALGAAMEYIGLPLNTVTLLWNDANNVAVSTAELLGLNTESAYMLGFDAVSQFMTDIDKDMERYIRDPGLIFADFRDKYQTPQYDGLLNSAKKNQDTIENNKSRITTAFTRLGTLNQQIVKLLGDIPEGLNNEYLDNLEGILTALDEDYQRNKKYIDEVISPFMDRVGEQVAINDELIKAEAKKLNAYPSVYSNVGSEYADLADEKGMNIGNMIFDAMAKIIQRDEELT